MLTELKIKMSKSIIVLFAKKMPSANCHLCTFKTYSQGYLHLHLKSSHANICFPCKLCDFVAVKKNILTLHTNAAHKNITNPLFVNALI